jgi:MoaA/NifB/PqqE/SkfB family radical SAM enzyme
MNDLEQTQKYSSWGDKLLNHADVLYSIQVDRKFKPITIQVAPTEICNSDCPFCSVAGRPLRSVMPFSQIQTVLRDFRELGAKAIEITGGGNPMLYKDGDKDINSIISEAHGLGYEIGIITNSHSLKKIKSEVFDKIKWIRISLIQLDEGVAPEDYHFNGFPSTRMGFSYIIYETNGVADEFSRTKKVYQGTTIESIRRILKLVELHPEIKFVRVAGNCLTKGNNLVVKNKFREIFDELDTHKKVFFKEIADNDSPFNEGCYVGMTRPYIAASPHGGDYRVYPCSSFVLQKRNYDLDYSLCTVDKIPETWAAMNQRFKDTGHPYEIKGNDGKNWCSTCKFCYYNNNNRLFHTVANDLPDKNFA